MIYSSYDCHYLLVSIFTFLVMNSLTPSKKVFSFTSVCLLSISCLTSSTYGSCLDSFLLIAVSGMIETYNTICTLVLLLKICIERFNSKFPKQRWIIYWMYKKIKKIKKWPTFTQLHSLQQNQLTCTYIFLTHCFLNCLHLLHNFDISSVDIDIHVTGRFLRHCVNFVELTRGHLQNTQKI